MKALSPSDIPSLFLKGLNSGDVDLVVSLYEPDGVVAAEPDKPITGRDAIREMLAGFLSQKPNFTLHDADVVECGDVALIQSRWTISMRDESGNQNAMKVEPSLVVRRQADGNWLVAIDRPRQAT